MRITSSVAIACLLTLPALAFGQSRDPMAGAWEMVSQKNLKTGTVTGPAVNAEAAKAPLRLIYLDGYYVQFSAAADRGKLTVPATDMTVDQLRDRVRMQGQYGTYKVSGNKVIRRTLNAADPNNVGREVTADFRVQGDQLIVTADGTGPNAGSRIETTYKRLRPGS